MALLLRCVSNINIALMTELDVIPCRCVLIRDHSPLLTHSIILNKHARHRNHTNYILLRNNIHDVVMCGQRERQREGEIGMKHLSGRSASR